MTRPRDWYVIFRHGEAIEIVQGLKYAERKVRELQDAGYSASRKKCRSEHAAQEFATWWNYDHQRHY